MKPARGLAITALVLLISVLRAAPGAAAPEGWMTWAVHISLAPTWFDPAETSGIITPFLILYALHDAMVKPMPGNPTAPGLAESWTTSPDGLVYREGSGSISLTSGTRNRRGTTGAGAWRPTTPSTGRR